ncbi:probable Werner syndrome ATP-dependent helicase homolog 1 [Paramuricea clavata]|uniref:DNA 3'-5' helicase n=1 Tax=Paramuricea clavata TaxID=317549 RepID=A0A6S7H4E3_PARCT|nr:probable Werner syndrome ATP-dependent helicase homolog 1 [Paramuricea clavata]
MHSAIQKEYKKRLFSSLKGDGTKRIAIAATSLSMGVNFPNIRYVIMFGLPRSLLDLHQQAGRGGRDGLQSDVVIVFYGLQVSHCDDDVRQFVNTTGCYRIAGYVAFDTHITALLPAHLCCNYCAGTCTCISDGCAEPAKPFETLAVQKIFQNHQSRIVSDEDKHLLSESLQELMKGMFAPTMSPFGITSSHGFSQELISDVVSNCHCIFTEDDIYHLVPIFSKTHVTKILGIFSEIFDDIDECALIREVAVDQQQTINHVTILNEFISTTGYLEVDPEFEDLDILSDE